jgi:hypothetical protein
MYQRPFLLPPDESTQALERLFERQRVVDLDALLSVLKTSSRMSVFRRLAPLGHLTSYSHAGRFYTLGRIPSFDPHGLWQHQGVLFSSHGSLKTTVFQMVDQSAAGWTHEELRVQLRVRVHNTLLDLVREKRIQRETFAQVFLYLSAKPSRATAQREKRKLLLPGSGEVEPFLVVEILVEVVHGARVVPDPVTVASRLASRGMKVSPEAVEAVYARHGLGKKTTASPSKRSRR